MGTLDAVEQAIEMLRGDVEEGQTAHEELGRRVKAYRADQVAGERDSLRIRFTGNQLYPLYRQGVQPVRDLLLAWYDSYIATKAQPGEGNKRQALETAHIYDMPKQRG